MSYTSNFYMDQPLHYFSGRIRAVWNDYIFFSDARNVAAVQIHDVFVHGKPASPRDLTNFEDWVGRSDWHRTPEFHSYVNEYPCNFPRPWPYKFSGKILWLAKCAWFGAIPKDIRSANMNNAVHMPISYYSGRIKEFYNGRILFGDMRNSVMVHSDNFYINGERGFTGNYNFHPGKASGVTIHAYIIRLEVLADNRLGGPEPDLPIWPKEQFSTDMWVAKFAWYGEMPDILKDQVGRYYVIRMNQWNNIEGVPWKNRDVWQGHLYEDSWMDYNPYDIEEGAENRVEESPVPREQRAGFMKGSLLLADSEQGLMTSFADLIAFNKEDFYINEEKFRPTYDLFSFFQNRQIFLTAWVIPLDKPKVIFNIRVIWHAVCVWYGAPPRNLEYIKNNSVYGEFNDNLVETSIPAPLTYFVGNLHSLCSDSGVLKTTAGLDKPVKISFKRKRFYLYGNQFNSNNSLLEKQQVLENNVWSVIAYPVRTNEATNASHYQALVMWHYNDQHTMNMLFELVSDFVFLDIMPVTQNNKSNEASCHIKEKEEPIQNLSGYITKVAEDYGIIKRKNGPSDATFICFKKDVLYVDGQLFSKSGCVQSKAEGRQCSMEAKKTPIKKIEGYQVTMEASFVWIGNKPVIKSGSRGSAANCSPKPLDERTDTYSCKSPEKVLHTAVGVMVGSIFIVDVCNGLIICSDIIAAFSSDVFYINGGKFTNKHGSLKEYCSDRKMIVRAMIVTLKEPKSVLNCWTKCECVCVWIGCEPHDLTLLQKTHQGKTKTSVPSKLSQESLLYCRGRVISASKDEALLASTTPEGTSKIVFSKCNLYVAGTALQQGAYFQQYKDSSQNWSVLALPIPPTSIMGHTVDYCAVAVWDVNHHHKMRKVLLVASQPNELLKCKRSICAKYDGLCDARNVGKATSNTPEDLLQALKLEDTNNENKYMQNGMPSHQNNSSVKIVSHTDGDSHKDEKDITSVDLAHFLSVEEFCGKHLTGYIVKKNKDGGGVAQWKSLVFEGHVFIEFNTESVYLNSGPLNKKWKVNDVQSKPCNFYVLPIPHQSVGEYTVSLKATCGWMGKKPAHLPAPGSQSLLKVDISSVCVSKFADFQDIKPKLDEMGVPVPCYQSGDIISTTTTPSDTQLTAIRTRGQNESSKIQLAQNREVPGIPCKAESRPPYLLIPKQEKVDKNVCVNIWEDQNKTENHHEGTIVEVHSSVGQLKATDGSVYYFSREHCYLYGVPLHNVELWHVLAQDEPVLYTIMELVPGMKKPQKVWLGALQPPNKTTLTQHILDWCQVKLVPDGARDILLSQLEMV